MAGITEFVAFSRSQQHCAEFCRPLITVDCIDWVSASAGAGPRRVLDSATAGAFVSFSLLLCVSFILLSKIVILIAKIGMYTA